MDSKRHFIVQEKLKQGRLVDHMKRRIPYMTEAELIPGLIVICDALRRLHKRGFIHGNISARSILIHANMRTGKARVKLNALFCLFN